MSKKLELQVFFFSFKLELKETKTYFLCQMKRIQVAKDYVSVMYRMVNSGDVFINLGIVSVYIWESLISGDSYSSGRMHSYHWPTSKSIKCGRVASPSVLQNS